MWAGVGVGGAYGSAVGHRADARGGVYELFVVALRGFSSVQPEALRQQPVVDVESVVFEVVVDLELARGLPELDQGRGEQSCGRVSAWDLRAWLISWISTAAIFSTVLHATNSGLMKMRHWWSMAMVIVGWDGAGISGHANSARQ